MPLQGLRRLALGDVDEATLLALAKSGEHLLVERKREIPTASGLGEAVASFANTIGGWLLLGVEDKGDVVGYEPKPGLDLQSHLGNLLANQVDPLPPFVAGMRELQGARVGVVRVFPSDDTPHIVRSTGAVYVRDSRGKQPIRDAALLISLARRGDTARRDAHERLDSLRILRESLNPEEWATFRGTLRTGEAPPVERFTMTVRAAPFTVTPHFNDWALREAATKFGTGQALEVAASLAAEGAGNSLEVEPRSRGWVATWTGGLRDAIRFVLAIDSGGAIGARIRRDIFDGHFTRRQLLADLTPLVTALNECLLEAEAYGQSAWQLDVHVPDTIHVVDAPSTPKHFFASSELTTPAESDELESLKARWLREYFRAAGRAQWEPPLSGQTL